MPNSQNGLQVYRTERLVSLSAVGPKELDLSITQNKNSFILSTYFKKQFHHLFTKYFQKLKKCHVVYLKRWLSNFIFKTELCPTKSI